MGGNSYVQQSESQGSISGDVGRTEIPWNLVVLPASYAMLMPRKQPLVDTRYRRHGTENNR